MLKLIRAFSKIREISFEPTPSGDLADIFRFSLVFTLLGLLLILGSSGVFGAVQTGRLSLETYRSGAFDESAPIFGDYFLDRKVFKGRFEQLSAQLVELVNARAAAVDRIRLRERGEMNRLKEEHKSLMWSSGGHGYDETDRTSLEFSKWSVAMYANIGQQTVMKNDTENKIAAWDNKNFVEVHSIEKNGKKFVLSIKVVRDSHQKKRASIKAVAAIR